MPKDGISGIISTSYQDFHKRMQGFAEGHFPLLVVIGSPGIAKSYTARAAMGNRRYLYFSGHLTPRSLYEEAYDHRDEPIIIDDIDALMKNTDALCLLKQLCDTNNIKTVKWSRAKSKSDSDCPQSFRTTSPVCLILNSLKVSNTLLEALMDRAVKINFIPGYLDLHQQVATWFDDQEVFDFIGGYLPSLKRPSMRHYIHGRQLKAAGYGDWRSDLVATMHLLEPLAQVYQRLANDHSYRTEGERVEAFKKETNMSRATYYRVKLDTPMAYEVPRLICQGGHQLHLSQEYAAA